MAEEATPKNTTVSIIDPFQVWKKMYFAFEDSLSKTVRDSVTTDSFANGIDWILNSYLQYLKLQKDFMSGYMEDTPFPSKRDVARVAELVVSLENKVDILEGELDEKLTFMEDQAAALADRLADQPAAITIAEFNKVFTPAMSAVKDLGKRVSDLDKAVKKIDASLGALSKQLQSDLAKKVPGGAATKPAPNPETK